MIILETQRLILREIMAADFDAWSAVLGDPEVMYAYEHGFNSLSDTRVEEAAVRRRAWSTRREERDCRKRAQ